MATSKSSRKKHEVNEEHTEQARPHLKSIPGGKGMNALDQLFSSQVSRAPKKKGRGKKTEIPPIELPKALGKYCDVFAAGKTVLKEIEFKVKFAEQKVREFCNESYVRLFANLKRRPPSIDFKADDSSLKFVLTQRTTLTHDKVEQLKDLGIPIDDYTELSGIEINMAAIRQHRLENKLQEGLANLGVPAGVIEECFTPKHELSSGFFDQLYTIAQDAARKGEDVTEIIRQVVQILNPSSQIRNVETKLTHQKAFDLIDRTEIEVDDVESV